MSENLNQGKSPFAPTGKELIPKRRKPQGRAARRDPVQDRALPQVRRSARAARLPLEAQALSLLYAAAILLHKDR